jgi:predicted acylesterase/phospholipase RssA
MKNFMGPLFNQNFKRTKKNFKIFIGTQNIFNSKQLWHLRERAWILSQKENKKIKYKFF